MKQATHYIFSLFSNPDHVSSLLSNLEEADISTKHVSLVASNAKIVDELSRYTGQFSGTPETLDRTKDIVGFSKEDEDDYVQKIQEGNVLVIIPTNATLLATVSEMVKDNGASESKIINKYPNKQTI